MSERLTAEEFEKIERGAMYDLTGPQAEAVCRELRATWAERDGLRARLAALEAQVGAQRAALLRLEWTLGPEGDGLCPACEGMESVSDHSPEPPGHAPDCFLAAALGERENSSEDDHA